jgi:hypothetical protein
MMKKALLILSVMMMAAVVQAQNPENNVKDPDKNTGLFGVIQGSYIKNYSVIRSISGQYSSDTELDASQSKALSLNVLMGYYVIPKRLSLGLGFGLDGYSNPGMNTAPLYGDLRFYMTSERNIPFVYLDYGGLVKFGETFHKGQLLKLGTGYKFFVSNKLCMTADIGFAFKSVSYTDQAISPKDAVFVKGVAFTVGFFLF